MVVWFGGAGAASRIIFSLYLGVQWIGSWEYVLGVPKAAMEARGSEDPSRARPGRHVLMKASAKEWRKRNIEIAGIIAFATAL